MYVLDTNSLVYFFKGEGRVGEQLLARKPAEVALPAVAATALAHRATLVTHNTREFGRVRGLGLEDWY